MKKIVSLFLIIVLIITMIGAVSAKDIRKARTNKHTFLVVEDGGALFPEVVTIHTIINEYEHYDKSKKKYKFWKRGFWYYVEIAGDYAKPSFEWTYRDRHYLGNKLKHKFSWTRKASYFPPCDYCSYYESGKNVYYTKNETKELKCQYQYVLYCKGAFIPTKIFTNQEMLSNVD